MNAEITRIRKNRNLEEKMGNKPERLPELFMNDMLFSLNTNMGKLYNEVYSNNIKIDDFIDGFIANIYIVLNIFNEMGIYPDYFYDVIVKMNTEYRKNIDSSNTLRGNYELFKNVDLSTKLTRAIKTGLDNKYYNLEAYPKKDINDAFIEMIGFFEAFNISYNICDEQQCKKVFNEIEYNHTNIIEELANSDYDFVDIECLSRLLFEYLSFFVSLGIHPKEYLDNYIDNAQKGKQR